MLSATVIDHNLVVDQFLRFPCLSRTMDSTIFGEPIVEIPGAILLSGFLQFFLLGIVEMQAIAYWADYRDDSRRKRMFIATVMFFCLLQTMLEGYKVWRTTIFQKRWTTSAIQWLDLFLNGLLSFLCEGFYVRRCWKMTNRSPWVLFPLSGLLLTIIVANIYLVNSQYRHGSAGQG